MVGADTSTRTARTGAPTTSLRPLVGFVVLAYALSWSWWLPMAFRGSVSEAGTGWPTHLPGLAGPAIAALVVTAIVGGRPGVVELASRVVRWRVGLRWYGLIALTALAAVAPVAFGAEVDDLLRYSGAPAAGLVVVVLVVVVNGFGEEIGWRGFLADRLLATRSVARTALVVWPVWACWHLPLFWVNANFREFGVLGTLGWAIGIGFGSVVLTWLYRSSRCSVLVVALWHTAYNFATATDAAGGVGAALVTTAVVVGSVVILRHPERGAEEPGGS